MCNFLLAPASAPDTLLWTCVRKSNDLYLVASPLINTFNRFNLRRQTSLSFRFNCPTCFAYIAKTNPLWNWETQCVCGVLFFHRCGLISTWFSYFCIFQWFFFHLMSPSNGAIRTHLWWKTFVDLSTGAGAPAELTQEVWDWTSEHWGKEKDERHRVKVVLSPDLCVNFEFLSLSLSFYTFSPCLSECQQ